MHGLRDHFVHEPEVDHAQSFYEMTLGHSDPSRTCRDARSRGHCIAYGEVVSSHGEIRCHSEDVRSEAEFMRVDSIDAAILNALVDNPFSSVRELSCLTSLSGSTIHRRLTKSLRLTVRYLRRGTHPLSDDQKAIRVNLSRAPLGVLEPQ
jgi:hypothetical protein